MTQCSVQDCERQVLAKALCSLHYERQRRTGSVGVSEPLRSKPIGACKLDGCDKPVFATKLCAMHYLRLRKFGEVGSIEPRRRPNGEGSDSQGYRRSKRPGGGWVLHHRRVMEEILGRPLAAHESVHHRNGDRPENLELWSAAQPAGQRVSDKVAHALWLLKEYRVEQHQDETAIFNGLLGMAA